MEISAKSLAFFSFVVKVLTGGRTEVVMGVEGLDRPVL
jgi:hypothetical protein